jgi:hypothetical protein
MQVIKQSTLGLLLKSSGIEKKNSDARDVVAWDSCYAVIPLSGWLAEKQEAAVGPSLTLMPHWDVMIRSLAHE